MRIGGHIQRINSNSQNYFGSLLHHIGVEHAVLFQIMRNRILRQKRRLNPDLGSDPFSFGVRGAGRVIAAASTAELWTEVRALNLIELLDLAPGLVAHGPGYVDFQSNHHHTNGF
jgi:hypothetical protein